MIKYELDRENGVLWVNPLGPLEEDDFKALASAVDPFIEERGRLAGLAIETESFPGWEGLGAMARHFQFVRGHHAQIGKIALITNSRLGDVAEKLAAHFVSATIRHFAFDDAGAARSWIISLE